jgi:hypothetical protein
VVTVRVGTAAARARRRRARVAGRVARAAVALATVAILGGAAPARRHPLHTTLAQVAYRADTRSVEVTLRIFADDLTAATHRGAAGASAAPPDSVALAYVASALVLSDGAGRPLALRPTGARRTGDLVWLTLSAPAPALAGLELRNQLLCDLYDDQVNIVQVESGGRRTSMLFTKGEGAKRIAE